MAPRTDQPLIRRLLAGAALVLGAVVAVPGPAFGQVAETGTIVVVNDTEPDGSRNFTFEPSEDVNDGEAFVLDDDDASSAPDSRIFMVEVGTHTVAEVDDSSSYDLTGIECEEDGTENSSGDPDTGIATFVVEADETVTCTFTNTLVYDEYPGDTDDDDDYDYGTDPEPDDPTFGTDPTNPEPINLDTGGEAAGDVVNRNPVPAPAPVVDQILGESLAQPATDPVMATELPRTGTRPVVKQAMLAVVLLGAGLLATILGRRRPTEQRA